MSAVNTGSENSVLTRRQRARAKTREEILTAAHDLVRNGQELNMRAVARAVGMTAPGLYRYFDGQEDLLDRLGSRLYDDLIAELEQARDALDPSDQIAMLFAMARAFRTWALAHRYEYGLLFASPLMAAAHTNTGCTHEAGMRFGAVFTEIFARMWAAGIITAPDLSGVDPELLRDLQDMEHPKDVDLPLAIRYLYVRQWTRLYGMVTLEAFGQLHWAMEDSTSLFEAMLDDCAAELGFLDRRRDERNAEPPGATQAPP